MTASQLIDYGMYGEFIDALNRGEEYLYDYDEPFDVEVGFDPYEGDYTFDC